MNVAQTTVIDQMDQRKRAMLEYGDVVFSREPGGIAYRGHWDSLLYLEAVPGSFYHLDRLIIPATRPYFHLVETIGKVEEASPGYLKERRRLLAAPEGFAKLYPKPPAGQPSPMAHQVEAFAWALDAFHKGSPGFGQWSDLGMGKTRWAVDLNRYLVNNIAIVVTQKICIGQWEETIFNCWPEAVAVPLTGSIVDRRDLIQTIYSRLKKNPDEGPVCFITNWESLQHLFMTICPMKCIDMLTLDESTRMKNKNAAMSRAARQIAKSSSRRVVMSGMPISNHPGDLWAQYAVINPALFGTSYWDYMKRYTRLGGTTGWEYQELQSPMVPELVEKVFSCSYRATKATLEDMVPKTYRRVTLDPLPDQKELYRKIAKEMFAEIEQSDGSWARLQVGSAMAKLLRLQQITAGIFPCELDIGRQHIGQAEAGLAKHLLIASAKTLWVRDHVQQTLQTNRAKLIVWSRFRPEIDQLYRSLTSDGDNPINDCELGIIDGRTSTRERDRLRRAFNDRSSGVDVLLCQIQAAAYGLDLPVTDQLIYHSSTFSYTDRGQSEDRGHRAGRDKDRPYEIIDLCIRGTVDEYILQTVEKKRSLADILVTGGKLHEAVYGIAEQ